MDITLIEYSFHSYKTTNPPISESTEFTVSKTVEPFSSPRFLLRAHSDRNGEGFRKEFILTQKQYDATVRLFLDLKLNEDILAALAAPSAPSMPPMMGGSTSETLTFCANEITVTARKVPQNTGVLVKALRDLLKTVSGEDLFAKTVSPGAAGMPPQFFSPIQKAADAPDPAAVPAGAWLCPGCGTQNAGAFCVECGVKKPE